MFGYLKNQQSVNSN